MNIFGHQQGGVYVNSNTDTQKSGGFEIGIGRLPPNVVKTEYNGSSSLDRLKSYTSGDKVDLVKAIQDKAVNPDRLVRDGIFSRDVVDKALKMADALTVLKPYTTANGINLVQAIKDRIDVSGFVTIGLITQKDYEDALYWSQFGGSVLPPGSVDEHGNPIMYTHTVYFPDLPVLDTNPIKSSVSQIQINPASNPLLYMQAGIQANQQISQQPVGTIIGESTTNPNAVIVAGSNGGVEVNLEDYELAVNLKGQEQVDALIKLGLLKEGSIFVDEDGVPQIYEPQTVNGVNLTAQQVRTLIRTTDYEENLKYQREYGIIDPQINYGEIAQNLYGSPMMGEMAKPQPVDMDDIARLLYGSPMFGEQPYPTVENGATVIDSKGNQFNNVDTSKLISSIPYAMQIKGSADYNPGLVAFTALKENDLIPQNAIYDSYDVENRQVYYKEPTSIKELKVLPVNFIGAPNEDEIRYIDLTPEQQSEVTKNMDWWEKDVFTGELLKPKIGQETISPISEEDYNQGKLKYLYENRGNPLLGIEGIDVTEYGLKRGDIVLKSEKDGKDYYVKAHMAGSSSVMSGTMGKIGMGGLGGGTGIVVVVAGTLAGLAVEKLVELIKSNIDENTKQVTLVDSQGNQQTYVLNRDSLPTIQVSEMSTLKEAPILMIPFPTQKPLPNMTVTPTQKELPSMMITPEQKALPNMTTFPEQKVLPQGTTFPLIQPKVEDQYLLSVKTAVKTRYDFDKMLNQALDLGVKQRESEKTQNKELAGYKESDEYIYSPTYLRERDYQRGMQSIPEILRNRGIDAAYQEYLAKQKLLSDARKSYIESLSPEVMPKNISQDAIYVLGSIKLIQYVENHPTLSEAEKNKLINAIKNDLADKLSVKQVEDLQSELQAKLETTYDTELELQHQLSTAIQELTQTKTQIQTNIAEQTQVQQLIDVFENTNTNTREAVRTAEIENTKTRIGELTKTPQKLKLPIIEGDSGTDKKRILDGTIEFRHGLFWRYYLPSEDYKIMHTSKDPLPGTYKFATGEGSAYRTVQVLGRKPKKDTVVNLGWATVTIKAKAQKGNDLDISFVGNETANIEGVNQYSDYIKPADMPEFVSEKIPRGYTRKVENSASFDEDYLHKVELPQYRRGKKRVYTVNAEYIRNMNVPMAEDIDSVDFTQGGHSIVYPMLIPHNETWIDEKLGIVDQRATLLHELKEEREMLDGKSYSDAHNDYANPEEVEARQNISKLDDLLEKELAFYEKNKQQYREPRKRKRKEEFELVDTQPKRKTVSNSHPFVANTPTYLGRQIRTPEIGVSL